MMLHSVTQVLFLLGCAVHCYTDYKEQVLYDEVSLLLLLLGLGEHWSNGTLAAAFLGAVATGSAFGLLFCICRGGLGLGDVKLALVLGAWLGWQQGLLCLLLALWLGCSVGLLLIVLGRKTRHDAIAFGPYMCVSGSIMLYRGEALLAWYCNLFI